MKTSDYLMDNTKIKTMMEKEEEVAPKTEEVRNEWLCHGYIL